MSPASGLLAHGERIKESNVIMIMIVIELGEEGFCFLFEHSYMYVYI